MTSFSNRSARASRSSRWVCPNLWISDGRSLGATNVQLQDQDLGLIDLGENVNALWGGVSQVGDPGQSDLGRDLGTRQPQIANLVTGQAVVLGLELLAPFPYQKAQRRNGMPRGEGLHHQLTRQFDLIAGHDPNQFGGRPSPVQPLHRAGDLSRHRLTRPASKSWAAPS